nr:PREDICTED: starch-binding domain-containing protein 1 isoform X2 [Latimeria chalumnae]|eukprot:XP_014353093.1 PREDICTED: starch-binding domain-containing protein 1 isoform X2 [Latimeria chalumnae]
MAGEQSGLINTAFKAVEGFWPALLLGIIPVLLAWVWMRREEKESDQDEPGAGTKAGPDAAVLKGESSYSSEACENENDQKVVNISVAETDSLLVEEEEEEEEEEAEEVVLDVKEGLHRTQNANVSFKVHYVTPSDNHLVAVTGSHEALGKWEEFHTLKPNSDGSWSDSVQLPKDARIEWKFVVVENGKILRWEECCNRLLETNHEDIKVYHTWGN